MASGWALPRRFCLSLTIVFCFRSIRWVIVPMAVVFTTLWMTEGLMVSGGFRLSMVSSMLWAVVAVIAIATVVHIVIGFRELRDEGFLPQRCDGDHWRRAGRADFLGLHHRHGRLRLADGLARRAGSRFRPDDVAGRGPHAACRS